MFWRLPEVLWTFTAFAIKSFAHSRRVERSHGRRSDHASTSQPGVEIVPHVGLSVVPTGLSWAALWTRTVALMLLGFTLFCSSALGAQAKTKARILLVTGVDYPGHPWQETAPLLRKLIQQDSRLTVVITEDPHLLDSGALSSYDAVLLHFMNWEVPAPGEAARQNLRGFVERGGGLVLVHFACGAWQDWSEFRNLAGRVWDPKLRAHDPRGVFRVQIVDRNHAITRDIEDFETDDELYTCLAGERTVRVLATAKSKVDGLDYPMAFVFNYGKGRVFHSPLGHDAKAFEAPAVGELFRRACAWTAGLFGE